MDMVLNLDQEVVDEDSGERHTNDAQEDGAAVAADDIVRADDRVVRLG